MFWDEPIIYSYCFTIRPGRIKGGGMHRKQADRYFLCAGSVRVALHDGRVRSPTYGAFAEFHLTEESRGLLLIPPGVWHGAQNCGDRDAVMLNFLTVPFDRGNSRQTSDRPPLGHDSVRLVTAGQLTLDLTPEAARA
jgi:dTDP-4-dehydrorhamnose 3,5-epimerase